VQRSKHGIRCSQPVIYRSDSFSFVVAGKDLSKMQGERSCGNYLWMELTCNALKTTGCSSVNERPFGFFNGRFERFSPLITLGANLALWWYRVGIFPVIGACEAAGLVYSLLT
jgi:hypothetical protein